MSCSTANFFGKETCPFENMCDGTSCSFNLTTVNLDKVANSSVCDKDDRDQDKFLKEFEENLKRKIR